MSLTLHLGVELVTQEKRAAAVVPISKSLHNFLDSLLLFTLYITSSVPITHTFLISALFFVSVSHLVIKLASLLHQDFQIKVQELKFSLCFEPKRFLSPLFSFAFYISFVLVTSPQAARSLWSFWCYLWVFSC